MTGRERLANRRPAITDSLHWGGKRVHVTVGVSADGRVLETFLRGGGHVGSDRDRELDDIAVVLSRLLQHGDKLDDIARGLGGSLADSETPTIIGAIVAKLIEIEGSLLGGAS